MCPRHVCVCVCVCVCMCVTCTKEDRSPTFLTSPRDKHIGIVCTTMQLSGSFFVTVCTCCSKWPFSVYTCVMEPFVAQGRLQSIIDAYHNNQSIMSLPRIQQYQDDSKSVQIPYGFYTWHLNDDDIGNQQ